VGEGGGARNFHSSTDVNGQINFQVDFITKGSQVSFSADAVGVNSIWQKISFSRPSYR